MGLDMYLKASLYVSGVEHSPSRSPLFDRLAALMGVRPDEGSPSFEVSANVGYWRKANAIHAWFVKNVQGGKDDCQTSEVGREQLRSLRQDCMSVLDTVETVPATLSAGQTTFHSDGRVENHTREGVRVAQAEIAAKVLPVQAGFFFGSTKYDDGYLQDLKDTVAIIDRALALPEGWDFAYRASW